MPFKSPYDSLDIPQTNILSYLFDPKHDNAGLTDKPIWLDSKDPVNKSLSKKSLLQWSRRLGYGLQRLGIGEGDVALICTPNHIFIPAAYLGITGAGCIFSGANPAYTVPELIHQLSNAEAEVVLAHPAVLDRILEAAAKVGIPKDRIFQFSDEENPTRQGIKDWRAMIGTPEQGDSWQWPSLTPKAALNTVATINYSSGTTGLPKGVCVSHANLIANVEQVKSIRYADVSPAESPEERWIGFLPLYHAYGQLYIVLMACKLRVPCYIMSEFVFQDFLDLIGKQKITTLHVAPPILVMLSKRPETAKYDLSSVEKVLCGAAPLSQQLQNDCQSRFGFQISQGWGMTEVTCAATTIPKDISDDTGSVGVLLPNCECKLVDDEGREVEVGQPGEMLIRGPNVCMGYWKNEVATRETKDTEGWLKTGDVAVCDKRGFWWIVDRKKELIKVNGLQVAPAELEAVLLENEHIADAAAVGIIIDESEWPRAYVVIQDSSKNKVKPRDIQDWIAARVSKHKRLVGGVVFIEAVPKLASGKIQRKVMREWAKKDAEELAKQGGNVRAKL